MFHGLLKWLELIKRAEGETKGLLGGVLDLNLILNSIMQHLALHHNFMLLCIFVRCSSGGKKKKPPCTFLTALVLVLNVS